MPPRDVKVLPGPISELFAVRAWARKKADPEGRTRAEFIIDKVLELAEQGDPEFVRIFFEYTQGKPPQLTTEDQMLGWFMSLPHERLAALSNKPLMQFLEQAFENRGKVLLTEAQEVKEGEEITAKEDEYGNPIH